MSLLAISKLLSDYGNFKFIENDFNLWKIGKLFWTLRDLGFWYFNGRRSCQGHVYCMRFLWTSIHYFLMQLIQFVDHHYSMQLLTQLLIGNPIKVFVSAIEPHPNQHQNIGYLIKPVIPSTPSAANCLIWLNLRYSLSIFNIKHINGVTFGCQDSAVTAWQWKDRRILLNLKRTIGKML